MRSVWPDSSSTGRAGSSSRTRSPGTGPIPSRCSTRSSCGTAASCWRRRCSSPRRGVAGRCAKCRCRRSRGRGGAVDFVRSATGRRSARTPRAAAWGAGRARGAPAGGRAGSAGPSRPPPPAGGPPGSTTSAFLALAGRRVLLVEREPFPRFHVGESLLPATLPILDRLGVHRAIAERGFQVKYGATFHDQESGLEHTFYFLRDKPWPSYAYQVPRADFDALLLEHAQKLGVDVRQPASVESVAFDGGGVTVTAESHGQRNEVRARFLVDASGRAGLLSQKVGRRERIPNLGKVALFAHWRGGWRAPRPVD